MAGVATTLPLISVIIPCYNYARYLPHAIDSALAQKSDALDVEVIVVDDGSTDATARTAQGYGERVRYIFQENQGPSAARNTGLRAAQGDFLLFLDADDLLAAGNLEKHLAHFARRPELDISVCLCVLTEDPFMRPVQGSLWPLKARHLDLHLCHGNISPVHTFLLRATAARACGYFDESLCACEDQDYWLRCAARGLRFGSMAESFVFYVQHGDSLSGKRTKQHEHDIKMQFAISGLLEQYPDFPRAGKYLGRLAHAAGALASARGGAALLPDLAQQLLQECGLALLKAMAEPRESFEDRHLALAEEYYASAFFMLGRENIVCLPPTLQKALGYLSRKFPHLAGIDAATLAQKRSRLFRKICCDPSACFAAVQKGR